MFVRNLAVAAGGVLAAAAFVPDLASRYIETAGPAPAPVEVAAAPVASAQGGERYAGNRSTVVPAGANGHFTGAFLLNGRRQEGMVDTGASLVAINVSTARAIGIDRAGLDFRHSVNTANGRAKAAYVELDSVEIGPVRVEKVGAVVLEDRALSQTLIGMSFLKGLSSYRVEDGRLHLTR